VSVVTLAALSTYSTLTKRENPELSDVVIVTPPHRDTTGKKVLDYHLNIKETTHNTGKVVVAKHHFCVMLKKTLLGRFLIRTTKKAQSGNG
jgi:hypothetical protein